MELSLSQSQAGGSNGVPGATVDVQRARHSTHTQAARPRRVLRWEAWNLGGTRRSGKKTFLDLPEQVRMRVYQYLYLCTAPKFLDDDNQDRVDINKTRQSLFCINKKVMYEWAPFFWRTKFTHNFKAWGQSGTPHRLQSFHLHHTRQEEVYAELYRVYANQWLSTVRHLHYELRTAPVGNGKWELMPYGADHMAAFLTRYEPSSLVEVVVSTRVAPNSHILYFDAGRADAEHRIWRDLWKDTSDDKEGDIWVIVQQRFQGYKGKNFLENWQVTRRLQYHTEKLYRDTEQGKHQIGVKLTVKSVQLVFRKNESGGPKAAANKWVEFGLMPICPDTE